MLTFGLLHSAIVLAIGTKSATRIVHFGGDGGDEFEGFAGVEVLEDAILASLRAFPFSLPLGGSGSS